MSIAPGRQDMLLRSLNPVFRSADIIVAPPALSAFLEPPFDGQRPAFLIPLESRTDTKDAQGS
jgi:hypothetical protein